MGVGWKEGRERRERWRKEERTSGGFRIDTSFDGGGETKHGVFGGSFVESKLEKTEREEFSEERFKRGREDAQRTSSS